MAVRLGANSHEYYVQRRVAGNSVALSITGSKNNGHVMLADSIIVGNYTHGIIINLRSL